MLAVCGGLAVATPVFAARERATDVKIFDGAKTTLLRSFDVFPGSTNGATIAVADTTGDGKAEIIVGSGEGSKPLVKVVSADGTMLAQFSPYQDEIRGGVRVAACDFDNDGIAEVVTGTGLKGAPLVRTFSADGTAKFTPGFYAFDKNFHGGVNVACGDVNGDGANEIVAGVGVGASPLVKVFDRGGKDKQLDIIPYADRDRGGVSVAVANTDGGKESEIITAIYRFGRSRIKVYKTDAFRTIVKEFEGWPETVQGGIELSGGDVTGDGKADVLAAIGNGDTPQILSFTGKGRRLPQNFFAYEKEFSGGVRVAIGDINGDGKNEIVTTPGKNAVQGSTDYQKYIEVRLDEQRLYAYENGFLKKTFLVSTGIKKYPTPPGNYAVLAKIPKKDYEWSYGDENPDNYDIKDVPWNLRFDAHLYLHDAFWHNNFGRPMSHGCVNINLENSIWLYNWADVGIPVIVK